VNRAARAATVNGPLTDYRRWRVVSATGGNEDDLYVTEYHPCELFPGNTPTCGRGHLASVDQWVGGRTPTHPVIWMNAGFHRIARDEDQQPMPVHWQGFALVPRDMTAMNPLTPRDLA
jgi:primary-amine oxidase